MFTVLFALGRLPGWIAHWLEWADDPIRRSPAPSGIQASRNEKSFPWPTGYDPEKNQRSDQRTEPSLYSLFRAGSRFFLFLDQGMKVFVTIPVLIVFLTASSRRAAASSHPRWLSIRTLESTIESGLTRFCPRYPERFRGSPRRSHVRFDS